MDPYGPWGLVCNLLRHMFFSASLPRELRGPEAPSSNGGQEADEWLGFSPTMTHALEEAYQTWLSEATRPSIAGLFGGGLAERNLWEISLRTGELQTLPVPIQQICEFLITTRPRLCTCIRGGLCAPSDFPLCPASVVLGRRWGHFARKHAILGRVCQGRVGCVDGWLNPLTEWFASPRKSWYILIILDPWKKVWW